ncbi:MAG: hypothetical protein ACOCTM_04360 [Bacteroidota bacterium]
MNTNDKHIDEKIQHLLNNTGLEKAPPGFTRKVMDQVEIEKRLHPYKRDNTFVNILIAIGLPVLYFVFRELTGTSFLAELDLTIELQPYIHLFQLMADKLVMDITTPVVPFGILAVVMLLAFDRVILRSLSLK